MTPTVPDVLAELAGLIARNAMPDVDPADRASALGLSALLLGVAAQDWDRAAARLVEENAAVRALLSDAPAALGEGELAARLWSLSAGRDEDLRVSALEAANAVLRAALIELHAAVEGRDQPAARALETAIWAELVASTERRRLAGAPV
jgi:cation diffusion facilitator CzcD-associated flavoprotein CzcO